MTRPELRSETVRASLCEALRAGPCTARDLSRAVGIPERDVARHLEHVSRSLRARGERLAVEEPRCLDCDFRFRERRRLTRPSHCPLCRSRRLTLPRFRVVPGRGAPRRSGERGAGRG